MKFRYYIIDLTEGTVIGTNNSLIATHYSQSVDFFVIDAQDGLLLQDDEALEINEVKLDE